MSGPGPTSAPPPRKERGVADLLHDLLTLAELQLQLVAVDLRQWLSRLMVPLVAFALAAALAAGCLPLGLVLLAVTLVETTTLSPAQSLAIALAAGLALAALLVLFARWFVRRRLAFLERSRRQWQLNLGTVKESLQQFRRN